MREMKCGISVKANYANRMQISARRHRLVSYLIRKEKFNTCPWKLCFIRSVHFISTRRLLTPMLVTRKGFSRQLINNFKTFFQFIHKNPPKNLCTPLHFDDDEDRKFSMFDDCRRARKSCWVERCENNVVNAIHKWLLRSGFHDPDKRCTHECLRIFRRKTVNVSNEQR